MKASEFAFSGPDCKIIDIGTWDNIKPSTDFAKRGCTVFAVDKYQNMGKFREKVNRAIEEGKIDLTIAGRIHPMKADACKLPFENSSVDLVLFHYSLSWMEQFGTEILNVFNESSRILRNEGIIIITESSVKRAKNQETILKTQMKVIRDGTVVIGYKKDFEESIFKVIRGEN